MGLFVGPALNLFLARFRFNIGPLLVDQYTAPGFLMTLLWVTFQVMMAFTYHAVDRTEPEPEEGERRSEDALRDPLLPSAQLRQRINYGSSDSAVNAPPVDAPPSMLRLSMLRRFRSLDLLLHPLPLPRSHSYTQIKNCPFLIT